MQYIKHLGGLSSSWFSNSGNHQNHLEVCEKHIFRSSCVPASACWEWGPRICSSDKFLSNADVAGPGTTFRELPLWVVLGEEKVENIWCHVYENFTIRLASDCRDHGFLFKQANEAKKHSMYSFVFLRCFWLNLVSSD